MRASRSEHRRNRLSTRHSRCSRYRSIAKPSSSFGDLIRSLNNPYTSYIAVFCLFYLLGWWVIFAEIEKIEQNSLHKSSQIQPLLKQQSGSSSNDNLDQIKNKYISYRMNSGRVNNQLVSFEAMVHYAYYYERTLVIPWPRKQQHVLGFECGFWDLDHLKQIINITMEDELPNHLKNYRNETIQNCTFHNQIGKEINEEHNEKCEMIFLSHGGPGPFEFPDASTQKNVMKWIIPAQYIRDSVETFLMNEFGALRYRIGVHRRAMNEGGRDGKNGDVHVCRYKGKSIHSHSSYPWVKRLSNMIEKSVDGNQEMYDKIRAIYHHSCAMDFNDLQNILLFHKQAKIGKNETYFIAHDHQEQDVVNAMKSFGGIEQPNNKDWTRSSEANTIHQTKCKKYGYCTNAWILKAKEAIIWDMWILTYADFLVGSWWSTLTRNVCHWKGKEASMYNGNMCFVEEKWNKTLNGKDNSWYTLNELNETALFD